MCVILIMEACVLMVMIASFAYHSCIKNKVDACLLKRPSILKGRPFVYIKTFKTVFKIVFKTIER